MYAVMIVHPLRAGLLAAERERVLEASRPWQEFLSRQTGFREYLVLGDPAADKLVALTLWESEDHFRAALDHPERATAGALLMSLFAAPATPVVYEVLAYERA